MKWTEKRYRQEVGRMKEQLSDEEIFLSEKYQNLLRKMASNITKGQFARVIVYQEPDSGICGWNNGEQIGINIVNYVTKSLPQKELKNISLIGYLGHECGHGNFSDFGLRRKYLYGIKKEHLLYPCLPKAESNEEKQSLKEMKEAFETGHPYLLSVFYEIAAYLQNFLEDLYVEEKMCRKYPGSIRQGILLNRKRWMDICLSVKKRKDCHELETAIMVSILVQSALCDSINAWDGEDEAYLECLESCKPYLKMAVCKEGENVRFLAANKILLKMWSFIRADAEKLEQEQREEEKKQKESQEEQKEDSKGNPEGEQENGESENEDGEQETNENSGKRGRDVNQDLSMGTVSDQNNPEEVSETKRKEDSDIEKQVAQRMAEVLIAYSPEYEPEREKKSAPAEGWNGSWETDGIEESQEAQKAARPEFQEPAEEKPDKEFMETETELNAFLYLMAKEKVDQQYESGLRAAALQLLDQIEFGQEHKHVEIRLFRSLEITEKAVIQYEEIERQAKHVRKRLQSRLLPVLEKRQTRMESGLAIGRRLDLHHVYRRDGKVFQKRQQPGEETDAAIILLIDQSYSMALLRLYYAKLAALCLYLFGMDAGIPVSVYGHHTCQLPGNTEQVCLHSYAEFDSIDGKDKYRIMGMEPHGANRDGAAIRFAGEVLLKRPEKKKFLILISDGLPNASGYRGDVAKQDLKEVKEKLENQGIMFLAAAIGEDKEKIQEIYGNAFLDISDVKKLPEKLTKEILKRIG